MMHDPMLHTIKQQIDALLSTRERLLVAIDGRCASGKTTLSAALSHMLQAPVIHMDHFFLRPHMRTPERLRLPGGNVDKERFLEEVVPALQQGKDVSYAPFDCHSGGFKAPIHIPAAPIILVEGTYACSPELWDCYDLRIFLTVDPQVQLQRIEKRNGTAAVEAFRHRWIPLEEAYFQAFDIQERCQLTFDTTVPQVNPVTD